MATITAHLGCIGGGKDHQTNLLVAQGSVRVDFKDSLLDLAADIAGYDIRADYDFFKRAIVGVKRPDNQLMLAYALEDMKKLEQANPDVMTGRRLLTRLGTEAMRKRDKDYWVHLYVQAAGKILANGMDVTTADCRFLNEVRAVRNLSAEARFVFCDFRSERYDPLYAHESERLAQALLKIGAKDGQLLTSKEFREAAEVLGEEWRE